MYLIQSHYLQAHHLKKKEEEKKDVQKIEKMKISVQDLDQEHPLPINHGIATDNHPTTPPMKNPINPDAFDSDATVV